MNDPFKPEITKAGKTAVVERKRHRGGPIEWRTDDGMTPAERQAMFDSKAPSKPKTR